MLISQEKHVLLQSISLEPVVTIQLILIWNRSICLSVMKVKCYQIITCVLVALLSLSFIEEQINLLMSYEGETIPNYHLCFNCIAFSLILRNISICLSVTKVKHYHSINCVAFCEWYWRTYQSVYQLRRWNITIVLIASLSVSDIEEHINLFISYEGETLP